jgi:hypothetical protein
VQLLISGSLFLPVATSQDYKGVAIMDNNETIELQTQTAMTEYNGDINNHFDKMLKDGLASIDLQGIGVQEEPDDNLPDILFMGESSDKIKIAFRNEIIKPSLALNNYTVVSFSLRNFAETCGILHGTLKDIIKSK